jgi:partitioning defective protein 3
LNSSNSSKTFPWKNREILTLHIPVHDTEKAGLGVSVKGKTGSSNSSTGSANSYKQDGDLGIFVKSVLHGGAASRDGRLKMNDQLLSINGISLLGQSNAEAMDTLRRAMLHTSGSAQPGKIVLSVARRIGRPMSTGDALEAAVESVSSGDQAGSTVIYLSPNTNEQPEMVDYEKRQRKQDDESQGQNKRWSNPVLDRLTGGTNISPNSMSRPSPIQIQSLRNESYYMATNENWSPCVNMNGSNAVLIEEDPEPTSP